MSLLQRILNIFKKPEPAKNEKSILFLETGDIVEVSFASFQVVGRVHNRQRNAALVTLQDGMMLKYLYIEERERTSYSLYTPIDGRLDSFNEVPTTIEMEGRTYYLEEQYSGVVTVSGKTPFTGEGEQYVWQFQSDDRKLLRIEWQNGRYMLYEGEKVLAADVKVLRGS